VSQYSSWVAEKTELALALAGGCCRGTYADGAVILCATISAMAAILWPGDKNDKKRFVEALIRFPCNLDPKIVSVPLLAEECDVCRRRLQVSNKAFYLTGESDKTEGQVKNLCTPLCSHFCKTPIRGFSYAHLLYKEVRCGFVHEYRPGIAQLMAIN